MTDIRFESLPRLVARRAETDGPRTFMTFGDGASMTYAEFGARVAGMSAIVRGAGIAPGERVALLLKNSLFYPVAWLGVAAAGAVAVPVNSRLGEQDARYILEHSGAAGMIVDDQTAGVAEAARPDAVRWLFEARAGDPMAELAADTLEADPKLHGGCLANVQYTSGTTGFPKGCLLSHRYWQRMGQTAVDTMGLTRTDVLLTSQPHSYIDPQWQVIATLRAGAHLVLLDSFHPSTFMRDIARFAVTVFYCLGVMPTLLMKQPDAPHDRDHSLTRVFCSAIPVDSHAEIETRWGVPWYEAFGMTETGINLWVPPEDHAVAVGTGCIGRAVDHNEASVFGPDDRELPAGEVGELCIRGVGMMEGYHDDPEATAAFFRNGWAHTGDLATRDEQGRIYYRGRIKEMIRRGGENIAPAEIEYALGTHPDVIECAVVPVPDPDMGEEIKAFVVTRRAVDPEELRQHLMGRIARFKVPRYWEFRDSLPHTSSEKVAKNLLRS